MARKTVDITITAEGRDTGKVFRVTEMSAVAAEKWAWKTLSALGRTGLDIPPGVLSMGMQGIAIIGIRAVTMMPFEDAQPLLDEMMSCVQAVPDANRPMIVRALIPDDTEEVATILLLRDEVMKLHTGFSPAAALLNIGEAASKAPNSQNTETSPNLSE